MESLAGCQLGISIYPTFSYNASGGGGIASASQSAENPNRVDIVFDPKTVNIPDVTYSTAKVGGVPLLPMFRIRVQPESLQVCTTTWNLPPAAFDRRLAVSLPLRVRSCCKRQCAGAASTCGCHHCNRVVTHTLVRPLCTSHAGLD